mmetsp:Transcript_814/g.1871  ORF Transcript_814/g.1871 Transcript_814/m.1871 type:complete len:424 (+) Transcript_814:1184-2455(+)
MRRHINRTKPIRHRAFLLDDLHAGMLPLKTLQVLPIPGMLHLPQLAIVAVLAILAETVAVRLLTHHHHPPSPATLICANSHIPSTLPLFLLLLLLLRHHQQPQLRLGLCSIERIVLIHCGEAPVVTAFTISHHLILSLPIIVKAIRVVVFIVIIVIIVIIIIVFLLHYKRKGTFRGFVHVPIPACSGVVNDDNSKTRLFVAVPNDGFHGRFGSVQIGTACGGCRCGGGCGRGGRLEVVLVANLVTAVVGTMLVLASIRRTGSTSIDVIASGSLWTDAEAEGFQHDDRVLFSYRIIGTATTTTATTTTAAGVRTDPSCHHHGNGLAAPTFRTVACIITCIVTVSVPNRSGEDAPIHPPAQAVGIPSPLDNVTTTLITTTIPTAITITIPTAITTNIIVVNDDINKLTPRNTTKRRRRIDHGPGG